MVWGLGLNSIAIDRTTTMKPSTSNSLSSGKIWGVFDIFQIIAEFFGVHSITPWLTGSCTTGGSISLHTPNLSQSSSASSSPSSSLSYWHPEVHGNNLLIDEHRVFRKPQEFAHGIGFSLEPIAHNTFITIRFGTDNQHSNACNKPQKTNSTEQSIDEPVKNETTPTNDSTFLQEVNWTGNARCVAKMIKLNLIPRKSKSYILDLSYSSLGLSLIEPLDFAGQLWPCSFVTSSWPHFWWMTVPDAWVNRKLTLFLSYGGGLDLLIDGNFVGHLETKLVNNLENHHDDRSKTMYMMIRTWTLIDLILGYDAAGVVGIRFVWASNMDWTLANNDAPSHAAWSLQQ